MANRLEKKIAHLTAENKHLRQQIQETVRRHGAFSYRLLADKAFYEQQLAIFNARFRQVAKPVAENPEQAK